HLGLVAPPPPCNLSTHTLGSIERTAFHTLFPVPHVSVTRGRAADGALGSPAADSAFAVLARAALTGLSRVGTLFPGGRHAFRVPCPGLFSAAPSGLQERGHRVAGFGHARPLPPVGAAPRGCPSGSNGNTLSRRGRRLEQVPVLRHFL